MLTNERLDVLNALVSSGSGATPTSWIPGVPLRVMVRGSSRAHPSIQLADVLAGVGAAVANRHAGVPTDAGAEFWPVIRSFLNEWCLLPYDNFDHLGVEGGAL